MNISGKSVKPNIFIKAISETITKTIQAKKKKKSYSMCGEFVKAKRKGLSRGVHCLQPVLIRSEHTGVSGSHIQVLEGIDLTLKNKALHRNPLDLCFLFVIKI